jgi:hypothetical protein
MPIGQLIPLERIERILSSATPGRTVTDVAQDLGLTVTQVRYVLQRYRRSSASQATPPSKLTIGDRKCLCCQKPFTPISKGNFVCRSCKQMDVYQTSSY